VKDLNIDAGSNEEVRLPFDEMARPRPSWRWPVSGNHQYLQRIAHHPFEPTQGMIRQ
jgi:hypothetical protein